jgi:hypothetical protein
MYVVETMRPGAVAAAGIFLVLWRLVKDAADSRSSHAVPQAVHLHFSHSSPPPSARWVVPASAADVVPAHPPEAVGRPGSPPPASGVRSGARPPGSHRQVASTPAVAAAVFGRLLAETMVKADTRHRCLDLFAPPRWETRPYLALGPQGRLSMTASGFQKSEVAHGRPPRDSMVALRVLSTMLGLQHGAKFANMMDVHDGSP